MIYSFCITKDKKNDGSDLLAMLVRESGRDLVFYKIGGRCAVRRPACSTHRVWPQAEGSSRRGLFARINKAAGFCLLHLKIFNRLLGVVD